MSTKPDKIVLAASDWLPQSYSLIGVDGKIAVISSGGKSGEQRSRKDFEAQMLKQNPDIRIHYFQDIHLAHSWLGED